MASYEYQTLRDERVIRILRLEPSLSGEGQLCGSFVLAPLDEVPDFEALSYVWGKELSKKRFKIHDGEIEIGANLDAALRQLRQPDKPRLVWADAICINQKDYVEKSTQVQIMAEIYRQAKTTIGRLGKADKQGETAVRKLSTIADAAPLFGYHSPEEASKHIIMVPIGGDSDLRNWKGNPEDVLAMATEARLDHIYNNIWFKRLWITQEAVLSSKVVLHFGSATVDWEVFEIAISLLYRAMCKLNKPVPGTNEVEDIIGLFKERKHQFLFRRPAGLDADLGPTSGFSTSNIHHLLMMNLNSLQRPDNFPVMTMQDRPQRFLDTIWNLRYRDCTDDRDRVYATRSLIPWDVPVTVDVDYSRTIVEVYTAFTRELLNKTVIKVLLFAGIWDRKALPPVQDPESSCEAPSWVCDFRLKRLERGASRPWEHPLEEDMDIEEMESPRIEWAANPLSRRLRIQLIPLDEVEDVEVCPTGAGWDAFELRHILCARLQLFAKARNLPAEKLPGYEEMEQFAQVLGIKTKEYPGAVTIVAQMVIEGRELVMAQAQQKWRIGDGFSSTISDDDQREFVSMVRRLSVGGAFFRTKQGWVGIGPTAIAPKDVVVRIMGLLTLCTLRKVQGQDDYFLVGGCYVHDDLGWGDVTTVSII